MRASLIVRREVQVLNGQPWLHDDGDFYPVLDRSQKHFADIEQVGTYSLQVDTLASTGAQTPQQVTFKPPGLPLGFQV